MVDVDPVLCHCGKFVPVESRRRPPRWPTSVCVDAAASPARYRASSSSKAASMSSGSNDDACRDPLVGVDLDDAERLGAECFGPLVSAREAVTTEGEALAAGRNDGRRHLLDAEVGDRPHVYDLGIATVPEPGIHHATAIVNRDVVGHHFGHRVPVAGREVASKRSSTRLAAFSSRGAGRLSSSKPASAASMSASSNISQRLIRSPSTVRSRSPATRRRSPLARSLRRVGDDRSEVAQPMHSLDVDA